MSVLPCAVCEKTVRTNQSAIFCVMSNLWSHLNFTLLSRTDYGHLQNEDDHGIVETVVMKHFLFIISMIVKTLWSMFLII